MSSTNAQHSASDWTSIVAEASRLYLEQNAECAYCGRSSARVRLHAHHIVPVGHCIALERTDLISDPRNLIALCDHTDAEDPGNHHMLLGHLGAPAGANLDVRMDVARTFRGHVGKDLHQSPIWQVHCRKRLPPASLMSKDEISALRWVLQGLRLQPFANQRSGTTLARPSRLYPWMPPTLTGQAIV